MQKIDKLRKFAEGGKVRKYQHSGVLPEEEDTNPFGLTDAEYADLQTWNQTRSNLTEAKKIRRGVDRRDYDNREDYIAARDKAREAVKTARTNRNTAGESVDAFTKFQQKSEELAAKGFGGTADGSFDSALSNGLNGNFGTMGVDIALMGMNAIDDLAMGDKNFGAQSQAIDDAVHGVSGALAKTGNPYCILAAGALEGANFLTKAGGQTVQGFDVDINSSGYGDMGHMESSSSRDFGAMIGLGGIFGQGRLKEKLAKRNAQALMAMNAANIANEQSFEQEARANSIQNTIMNNQIALAGGLETSLLGG